MAEFWKNPKVCLGECWKGISCGVGGAKIGTERGGSVRPEMLVREGVAPGRFAPREKLAGDACVQEGVKHSKDKREEKVRMLILGDAGDVARS